MKKLFILAALTGMIALFSCDSKKTPNTSGAAETIDSLVNEATSAVSNAADSVAKGVKKATDSTKAAIDSAMDNK